jgi:vancomycin resistance protein VanW
MARKRLTQLFPWLLPIRRRQRRFVFYTKMHFDHNRYARLQTPEHLPFLLFQSSCPMYNTETGFPMVYQENKVFNLKLAAKTLDGLVIAPGETFSFWDRVRYADRKTPYRDALEEVDGRLQAAYGGGLCQISNLLCWLFLHTPLIITERHGHSIKAFPEPPSDAPRGVDATVAEGWLDLRARNGTDMHLQLSLTFDESQITGRIFAARDPGRTWRVVNRDLHYFRTPEGIFEAVDVIQQVHSRTGILLSERRAYRNRCRIDFPLSDDIIEKG